MCMGGGSPSVEQTVVKPSDPTPTAVTSAETGNVNSARNEANKQRKKRGSNAMSTSTDRSILGGSGDGDMRRTTLG